MKKLFVLLVVGWLLVVGCDENFPQSVTVVMPYSGINTTVVDSAFLLVWRGADATNSPMLDSMEVTTLDSIIKANNINNIKKYSVPITGNQYVIDLPPSGEQFKVAGYVKDGKLTSLLAVKNVIYQLPTRPAMMQIGNIQMSY